MKRPKITPTNKEIMLKEEDFIISKTDTKSKIIYGNKIFIEISGYSEEELLNKPHNILRHPDMPRAAFKILYDHIQNGKEWFGYVKNLRKDGGFYWVFANISPTFNEKNKIIGYYSVRRKPNDNFRSIIEPLYKDLKETEEKEGMEASIEKIEKLLKKHHMSFNELMIKIQKGLIHEI